MVEVRLLGTIAFDGVDPEDAAALLAHPRWIATLTCLLLPDTGDTWSREDLASLLWPSVDRTHARLSLRAALHGIRRHLGRGAVRSAGDGLVVDRDRIRCDAIVFQARLDERRFAEALDLYPGDLLPGVVAPDASRFHGWLANRRDALRRGAAEAAWALSAASERRGRWIEAVRHARAAVEHSGRSEAAVRRLLRILDRSGDGAAAMRAYARFSEGWRRELGIAPSAETRAVVDEIRRTRPPLPEDVSAASGEGEPAHPSVRTDRWLGLDRIVVLPFEIQGDDRSLDHVAAGLAHDVISSLARVSGIVVVARPSTERLLDGLGRLPVEVGLRLDADLVLDPSVRIVGDRFLLVARLLDVRLRRPVWADVYEGSRAQLLELRRRLLEDVLEGAGVGLSPQEAEGLARGHTASPEAFELYLEGHSRLGHRTSEQVAAAIARFEAALASDPSFALARAGLMEALILRHPALGHRLSEIAVLARRAGREALALDPALGEVHAILGFLRGFLDHDWAGAVDDLRRAIERSPGHASAHHWLGAILSFSRTDFDEGARELEIARQLDPYSPVIRADIGLARANRGDLADAHRLLEDLERDEPAFWRAPYYSAVVHFAAGAPDAGAAGLLRAWRLGAFGTEPERPDAGDVGSDWRAPLKRRLARLERSRLQPGTRAVEAAVLAMVLGRRTETLAWLDRVTEQDSSAWILMFLPVFEPLRKEPGFQAFLRDAGLPEDTARAASEQPEG